MNIFVGPDSFKGSVSAEEFCQIAARVIKSNFPEDQVTCLPLADGGEGTVEALVAGQDGSMIDLEVTGPLGDTVKAQYGLIDNGDVAVIEMASASGLPLVPKTKRNPMKTTTYGTGELIKDAIGRGVKRMIIGIGGSATCDAGLGMMQALGFKCLDNNQQEVPYGGEGLLKLTKIIPPEKAISSLSKEKFIDIQVACDVKNPLYGCDGAAFVYGPQKGATPDMVELLDQGLQNFARVVKESLGIEVSTLQGGGAAGGLGAGLVASLNAKLQPGFEIVKKQVGIEQILDGEIDLIITAEGQMNHQSLQGKLPIELAKLGKERGIPTIAIVGARDLNLEEVKELGIRGIFPIASGPMSLEESMKQGPELIEATLRNVLEILHLSPTFCLTKDFGY